MSASLGWTPQEGSAVICVIIVMKMIISYTDKSLHSGSRELASVRAQSEAEEKNVLLRYAWHDTSDGAGRTAVLRLQEELYTALMDSEGQWAGALSEGVTFEKLMESPPMLEHFWSRPEFKMRVGFEVEQKDDWAPLKRVMESTGGTIPVSPVTLARQSLFRWCSDETELPKYLLQPPFRTDEEERTFRQVQGWSLGKQDCIRVLFDPGLGSNPTGFQDLKVFTVTPKRLKIGQHGTRGVKWSNGSEIEYRLIASVSLGPPVYVRIYDKTGQYSVPRALSSQNVLCLNNDWELGQLGSKYMLYYARVKSTDAEEDPAAEERPPTMSARGLPRVADNEHSVTALPDVCSIPPPGFEDE